MRPLGAAHNVTVETQVPPPGQDESRVLIPNKCRSSTKVILKGIMLGVAISSL